MFLCSHDHSGMGRRSFVGVSMGALAGAAFGGWTKAAPGAKAQAKQVLVIFEQGGVSQMDTFDPKPEANAAHRSPFKTISTKVPGIQFTELCAKTAQVADKLSVVRCFRQPAPGVGNSQRMPKKNPALSKAQIESVEKWIRAGAAFDGPGKKERLATYIPPRVHPAPPDTYRVPVPVTALCFAPDGSKLYAGGLYELTVWDTANGALLQRIKGLPQRIQDMVFHPDGKTLIAGGGSPGEYGELTRVDTAAGTVKPLAVFEDMVLGVAISPDGKFIASGGADNGLRGFDFDSGTFLWKNDQHSDWVTSVDFTPYRFAEETLANKDVPGFVKFNEDEQKAGEHPLREWIFETGWILHEANWELSVKDGKVESLTYKLASGIGGVHYKVDKKIYTTLDELEKNKAVVDYLQQRHRDWGAKARHQYLVMSSSKDMRVGATESLTGKAFMGYMGHRKEFGKGQGLNKVYGVAALSGSRSVFSAGEGNAIQSWDPVAARDECGTASDGGETRFAREKTTQFLEHDAKGYVTRLRLSGDGLLAACSDGLLLQFDLEKNVVLRKLNNGPADLYALAVNSKQSVAATAGYDGMVHIWNLKTGKAIVEFTAAPGYTLKEVGSVK